MTIFSTVTITVRLPADKQANLDTHKGVSEMNLIDELAEPIDDAVEVALDILRGKGYIVERD